MNVGCIRCGNENPKSTIMSKFNFDIICSDCKERETKHPRYAEADKAEVDACLAGNMNFAGIGCPPELYLV